MTYPDTLLLGARVASLEHDRFTMEYVVVSQEKNKVAAKGEGMIVYFDYTANTKTAVPEPIRSMIIELEGERLEIIDPS